MQFMNYDRIIFINILEMENYYGVASDASPVRRKRIFESRLRWDKVYTKTYIIYKLRQRVENKSNIPEK